MRLERFLVGVQATREAIWSVQTQELTESFREEFVDRQHGRGSLPEHAVQAAGDLNYHPVRRVGMQM